MSLSVHAALAAAAPLVTGRVRRVVGLKLEVEGLDAAIGEAVVVDVAGTPLPAEVVALRDGGLVCMPFGTLQGVRAGAPVQATGGPLRMGLGTELLGRVLDGLGRPVDGGPSLAHLPQSGVDGIPPHPLRRARVQEPLALGVRALDTLVPVGRGQRLGIFAGSGVGQVEPAVDGRPQQRGRRVGHRAGRRAWP